MQLHPLQDYPHSPTGERRSAFLPEVTAVISTRWVGIQKCGKPVFSSVHSLPLLNINRPDLPFVLKSMSNTSVQLTPGTSRRQGLSAGQPVLPISSRLPFLTDWRFAPSSLLHTGNAQNTSGTSPEQQQDSNQVGFFFFFSRRTAMPSLLLPCHLITSSRETSRGSTPTTTIRPLPFRTLAQNQSLKARRLAMARTAVKSAGKPCLPSRCCSVPPVWTPSRGSRAIEC